MQTGKNFLVAAKVEAQFNVAPGTGSGKRFRIVGSPPGLKLNRTPIRSTEINTDGQTRILRLGSNMIDGSYPTELSLASYDDYFEALFRGTWVPATAITQATAGLTSINVPSTSTIGSSAGSFITAGFKAGDVVRMTGFATVANNNINLRIKSVAANLLTFYGTPLTIDAVFDTTFTLTIAKKLTMPAVPVRRSFSFEQYYKELDLTELFSGVRVASLKLAAGADAMALAEWGLAGASVQGLATGASPYFVAPTETTSIPLVWADASIAVSGSDVAVLSDMQATFDNSARGMAVIGSQTTPDVFDNLMQLTGQLSGVRQDLAYLTKYQQETQLDLHGLLVEPESEPKDFISVFIPNVKLIALTPKLGQDGAMIETMGWEAGIQKGVSGYDDTMATISTSAP
jgi:hypothetical protein